jgi:dsRNA-specific ribonuclease
MTSIEDR